MALFDKIAGTTPPVATTKPARMTTSTLRKAAMAEPSKTQTYNPRKTEMELMGEKDLGVLKPAIEDLFGKLGQAFMNTPLSSKINALNTLKAQVDAIIAKETSK
jgi:hypothetical protein